eukprot:EG_transcript_57418
MVQDPRNQAWATGSVEFCGGTHLARGSGFHRYVVCGTEKGVFPAISLIISGYVRVEVRVCLSLSSGRNVQSACHPLSPSNTAEAERLVVLEETGIAKGVRRIVAVTRDAAAQVMADG